ncbi:MAG: O-antigen ligase family protein [Pseudoxanthomonas sp.]
MNQPRPVALDSLLSPLAIALLVLAFLTGGSSMERGWGDVATQLLALPVLFLAVRTLLQPPVSRSRKTLLTLAALGPSVVALQLALGITATPWATERAIYAWLPPMAAFLAALALPLASRRLGLKCVVGLACASLVLACLQLVMPQDSVVNPYPDLVPLFNGLFANPNHQGTTLAIAAILLLSGATAGNGGSDGMRRLLGWGRIALAVLLLFALPFTGSRGMVLIAAAAVVLLPLANGWLGRQRRRRGGRRRVLILGGFGLAGLALVASIALGWMQVDRMGMGRSTLAAATAKIAVDSMPLGVGAGGFVQWFDAHTPAAELQYAWVNHAHNEYLQWWLEAGVAGLAWGALLLGGFIWARPRRDADGHRPGRAWVGSWLGVGILLAHSVVDYPLRTPALATAGAWMAAVVLAAALKRRKQGSRGNVRTSPPSAAAVSAEAVNGSAGNDRDLFKMPIK